VSEVELTVNMFQLNKFYKVDHRLQSSDEVLAIGYASLAYVVSHDLYIANATGHSKCLTEC